MISSHVWLLVLVLVFGVFSFLKGAAKAEQHPVPDKPTADATAVDKPGIFSLDDALRHAADNTSPAQLEATLLLGDLEPEGENSSVSMTHVLLQHLRPGRTGLLKSAAEISIKKIGAKAIPLLNKSLGSSDRDARAAACTAIHAIGPDAIELLPKLIEIMQSGESFDQRSTLYAMQGFGDQAFDAIEPVADCLASDDFNVHCMACRFLEHYGSDALPAEKGLIEILNHGVPSSRGWAAIALGAIGPTDKNDIVPILIARLTESRAHVEKQRILLGLAYLGREAQRAIPTVTEYLNSRTHRVKPHAAYALYRITGEPKEMTKALSKSLGDINEQHSAFDLIKRLDVEEAIAFKPKLVELLSAEEEDVREKAVLAIGRLGPAAKDTLPQVKKLLKDPDVFVREAAAQTIASLKFKPTTKEAGVGQGESTK